MTLVPVTRALIYREANGSSAPGASVTYPGGAPPTPTLSALTPSTTFQVGVAVSGALTGATAGSTITANIPGISVNSAARTYSGTPTTAGSYAFTETLAGASNSPRSTSVTVAAAAPVLGSLTLSSATYTSGTAASGTITGATAGSAIALANGPPGFTINSAARTWAYAGSAGAAFGNLTLTETLAGATGSPRATTIAWTVASGIPANALTLNGEPLTLGGEILTLGA